MTHGSLFSGIGGFDLAAEWMGWENVFHCEWNEFGKKVLHHYWPQSISYHDITKTDFTIHRGKIDILTGGFPCQPYSSAGKRKGKEDERHLWPEMLRAIREIQPRWVVGENVLGLVNWSGGLVFHEVQADLEAAGYEVWPYVLPAVSVNAPHRRDRVWFVAYASGNGYDAESGNANNTIGQNNKQSRTQRKRTIEGLSNEWPTPHPNDVRLQQRKNTGEMGGGQAKMGEQGSEFTNAIETNGKAANVTHPNGNGFNQRNGNDEEQPSERGEYALCNADTGDEYGDVADTNGIGLRGESNGIGKSRFTNEAGEIGNWQNFPTQSPICSRNDGLSSRLDNITFSKWRNESIKAAGNAIVPQVVLMIFKAIEEYETTPPLENTL
jgi:DNA (cytosine-5)-methyltransferase 1